jgi:hypothetical protein
MTFVVYSDNVKGRRVDPYYYQPKFREKLTQIEKSKFEVVNFGDIIIDLKMVLR